MSALRSSISPLFMVARLRSSKMKAKKKARGTKARVQAYKKKLGYLRQPQPSTMSFGSVLAVDRYTGGGSHWKRIEKTLKEARQALKGDQLCARRKRKLGERT